MDEEKEPADDPSKEGPISLDLSDQLGFTEGPPKIPNWKKKYPYPSKCYFEEGEYIPQPVVEITANNEWWNSKLQALSQFAKEARWFVRLIAFSTATITLGTDYQFSFRINHQWFDGGSYQLPVATILNFLSALLLIVASFRFRVVLSSEETKLESETSPPKLRRQCPECGEELRDNPDSCSNCSWES